MSEHAPVGIICDHESHILQGMVEKAGYETFRIQAVQLQPDAVPEVAAWLIDCVDEDSVVDAIEWLEGELLALSNRPDPADLDEFQRWCDKMLRALKKVTGAAANKAADPIAGGASAAPLTAAGGVGAPEPSLTPATGGEAPENIWIMAGATGCLGAASEFLWSLKPAPPVAFLYAQHTQVEDQEGLLMVGRVNPELSCVLAHGRHSFQPGQILVAPADCRLEFGAQGEVLSQRTPWGTPRSPNIDMLMLALSELRPAPAGAILFSGSGKDGIEGLKALKAVGTRIYVQDPETADDPSMPHRAIQAGLADVVGSPSELAEAFRELYPA